MPTSRESRYVAISEEDIVAMREAAMADAEARVRSAKENVDRDVQKAKDAILEAISAKEDGVSLSVLMERLEQKGLDAPVISYALDVLCKDEAFVITTDYLVKRSSPIPA